ncbi:gustatory receptor for sugar taste 64f-like [Uranotaenia lowii]|uniref:gustatory receptor for sugar taste 64f-like n=1 Tax=Uranotaenia lowii TaxID=190385 RepID=UPI002479C0FA|nr:gustatory receptor for sugar taste 64f-like [Uranotaenia lowii]
MGAYYVPDACEALISPILLTINFQTFSFELNGLISCMFFSINLMISIGFTILARRWPALMTEWTTVERSLPQQPQLAGLSQRNRRRVLIIMTVLILSALFEHALAKPAGLYRAYKCGITDLLEAHLMQAFPEMFSFLPFSIPLGFAAQIITSWLTFYWNYVDLFIIVLCIGLRQNIQHVNEVILQSKDHYHSEKFWHDHWRHFQKASGLVHKLKKKMSYLVVVSFSNNTFFICIQLIGVLKPAPGFIVAVYVWYSLGHLIIRMIFMTLYAADVYDESRRLLPLFRSIPNHQYNKEFTKQKSVLHDYVQTIS